jgi:hypothetical protein
VGHSGEQRQDCGIFVSREAALRFGRLESPDEHFAVVDINDELKFVYAAQHL